MFWGVGFAHEAIRVIQGVIGDQIECLNIEVKAYSSYH